MISFACKEIEFSHLLKCSFGLTKGEYKLLNLMLDSDHELSALELAKKAEADRSTAQKALSGLMQKGLAMRRQVNQSVGGYLYYYHPLPKPQIKNKMLATIGNWHDKVKIEIEHW